MNELSEYFGGARGLGKVSNDESLKIWFGELSKKISELTYGDTVYTGRKINQFSKALEEIE